MRNVGTCVYHICVYVCVSYLCYAYVWLIVEYIIYVYILLSIFTELNYTCMGQFTVCMRA